MSEPPLVGQLIAQRSLVEADDAISILESTTDRQGAAVAMRRLHDAYKTMAAAYAAALNKLAEHGLAEDDE